MRKKVLLIQPPFERLMNYSRFYFPLGLLSLAAVLEKHHHEVLVYDADYNSFGISYGHKERMERYNNFINALEDSDHLIWHEIKSVINQFKPQVLGITVNTVTLKSARLIAQLARQCQPDVKIVMGGVHATLKTDECVPFADYVVQNEGEELIVPIVEGQLEKGVYQGDRLTDLDQLPFPALHLLYNVDKYDKRDLSLLMSSRGCPGHCHFCNSPQLWNRKVVRKSVDYFIKEIEHVNKQFGVTDFFISDDSFTINKRWLREFCQKIAGHGFTWRCLGRIKRLTGEMLDQIISAGCRNIKVGIESGSPKILRKINKEITREEVLAANELFRQKNMDWSSFFMIGFPGETEEDIYMTQDLIKKLSAKSITLSIFTPFPETKLNYSRHNQYEYYAPHSPHNNFTDTMSDKTFSDMVSQTLSVIENNSYYEHEMAVKGS
ncbi:MAG: B12-binding domain-containing radical SAM protein [Desulfobacteraceae bacterium]|nr:B12-binding domain-containing radical SAM protein [Desulfobacteraceae bacterium]